VCILCLSALALWLALVPLRITWAAAVVYVFSKPVRSPRKTIPELVSHDTTFHISVSTAPRVLKLAL
jgi:hypothetical protein